MNEQLVDAPLEVDRESLLELARGANLYASPFAFVRELLQNAVDAAGASGEVRVRTEHDAAELRVCVADTGPGIAPERLADLFELRFSERAGRVRFHTGLATAWETVEAHGGRIAVDGGLGRGATFTFHLPRAGLSR